MLPFVLSSRRSSGSKNWKITAVTWSVEYLDTLRHLFPQSIKVNRNKTTEIKDSIADFYHCLSINYLQIKVKLPSAFSREVQSLGLVWLAPSSLIAWTRNSTWRPCDWGGSEVLSGLASLCCVWDSLQSQWKVSGIAALYKLGYLTCSIDHQSPECAESLQFHQGSLGGDRNFTLVVLLVLLHITRKSLSSSLNKRGTALKLSFHCECLGSH